MFAMFFFRQVWFVLALFLSADPAYGRLWRKQKRRAQQQMFSGIGSSSAAVVNVDKNTLVLEDGTQLICAGFCIAAAVLAGVRVVAKITGV